MSIIRVMRKFMTILSSHQKKRIVQLLILMLIGGFFEMFSVSLIVPFMNMVVDPEAASTKWYAVILMRIFDIQSPRGMLVGVALFLAIIYVLKNIYLILETYAQNSFVYGNRVAIQRKILENLIHHPYEFFLSISSGDVIRIIQSDTTAAFSLLAYLLSFFTEFIVSLILVITIFVLAPMITLCTAGVLIALLLVTSKLIRPRMRAWGIQSRKAQSGMNKWVLQAVQGIKELKVMRKEQFFQENYGIQSNAYVQAEKKSKILSMAPRNLIEAVTMGTIFLMIAIYIYGGAPLESLIPVLSAVAVAAMRLLPAVNRMSIALSTIAYNEPMLDKLIENLQTVSGKDQVSLAMNMKYQDNEESTRKLPRVWKTITFDEISYHYPNTETFVLQKASMRIQKGESVGIVGTSGAGKSTAIDILIGLLYPQEGQVLLDNVNTRDNIGEWISQIGYIPQSIFMLDDTIRVNVAFGEKRENMSEEDIWRALEEASLKDFVQSLPDGLDTEIGERGVRLSGGQRQRIGIARALYFDPTVLVFDEATSALDNETEAMIMESIYHLQGKKTMIIIAHRLTTIESCDHIFRVENGKIIKER